MKKNSFLINTRFISEDTFHLQICVNIFISFSNQRSEDEQLKTISLFPVSHGTGFQILFRDGRTKNSFSQNLFSPHVIYVVVSRNNLISGWIFSGRSPIFTTIILWTLSFRHCAKAVLNSRRHHSLSRKFLEKN